MTTKTSKAKTNPKRSVVSIHTKPQLNKRLSALAVATGQTKSSLANDALESYLDHQEWVVKEIKRGIESAKAGRVIEHADMLAWAKSLGKK